MSFILDALKKSEVERQRKSVPGFSEIPSGRDTSHSNGWWWIGGCLLTVNLVVLLGLFLRPLPREAVAPAPLQQTPVAASEASVSEPVKARKPDTRDPESEAAATLSPPAVAPQERPVAAEPPKRGTTTLGEALLTLQELQADGKLQLPELHLDIHVYSEQPSERFVFINMSRYNENSVLAEGPVVKKIMPEGVLLEHRDQRFLLPRR